MDMSPTSVFLTRKKSLPFKGPTTTVADDIFNDHISILSGEISIDILYESPGDSHKISSFIWLHAVLSVGGQ